MKVVEVTMGEGPLVLGLPHGGTHVPPEIWARLNEKGRHLADTDWHVGRLYEGLGDGVTTVAATHHRYVVDANRDPSGASLYPGQATTDLVPLTDFDGAPLWDDPPTEAEVSERTRLYHAPYHVALAAEMERVRERHGVAILWDAHSIRSRIPRLFKGVLPDLNIGTDDGRTCGPDMPCALAGLCAAATDYSMVINGRFRGGWTTRHYGRPHEGWHAVQMEVVQSTYLAAEAPPWTYDDAKAARLRTHLDAMLRALPKLVPFLRSA